MRPEDALGDAACLKQHEAQKNRIAYGSPYRSNRIAAWDLGPLLGLWLQSSVIGLTMQIMGIIIFVLVYGRMIEWSLG